MDDAEMQRPASTPGVAPQDAIKRIIAVTKALEGFWRQSHGWAPVEAAELLASVRLDRQVSFTHTLSDYLEPFPAEQADARQILGYATLRSLCEGVLKLFFAVWLKDYRRSPEAVHDRSGNLVEPAKVRFERLIALYSMKGEPGYESFLRRIQQRGNAIHHFVDRDIGSQSELLLDIVRFSEFLLAVNDRLPYPDDMYNPARA